jgi:hypothetical protein
MQNITQALSYIQQEQGRGVADGDIQNAMRQSGWSEDSISTAYQQLTGVLVDQTRVLSAPINNPWQDAPLPDFTVLMAATWDTLKQKNQLLLQIGGIYFGLTLLFGFWSLTQVQNFVQDSDSFVQSGAFIQFFTTAGSFGIGFQIVALFMTFATVGVISDRAQTLEQ